MHETPKGIISSAHLAAGRAVDQLRRQLGIVLQDHHALGACPIEGVTPELLATLHNSKLGLLLTSARANYLGIKSATGTVCIDTTGFALAQLQVLADPLSKSAAPENLKLLPAHPAHETIMTLVKHAALLPAALLVEGDSFPAHWLPVALKDAADYWAAPPLDIVPLAEASLPIHGAEKTRIVCFRERHGTSMHLALLVGSPEAQDAPLLRMHSSCITGDILGSLRCDCGDQLQMAISQIIAEKSGVLLYLHQEGRGIGIANKIRAYALQEQGVDTYDANLMLGFAEDERDFSIAAAMLQKLGIKTIRLMTNNPRKLDHLKKLGVNISERVPLKARAGEHNHAYLDAKAKKSGHLF